MKGPLLFFLLGLSAFALHADILANGDFADGAAHWRGDGSDSGNQSLVIQLDHSKWTYVSQLFNTKDNALDFSITYKTSSDCVLPTTPQTCWKASLFKMTGIVFNNSIKVPPSSWLVMVYDSANLRMGYCHIPVTLGSTDPQQVTGTVPKLVAHAEKTVFIAFPPGEGSITLLKVALTPSQGSDDSDSSPAPGN